MSHYVLPEIVHLPESSDELTLRDLQRRAQSDLGSTSVTIELSRDVIEKFVCPACHEEEERFAPVGSIPFADAKCSKDGQLRSVVALHSFTGEEEFGSRRLSEIGVPLLDVFTARDAKREIAYIPYGDARKVLGELAAERTPV
jgi:hypothetical protein